ncbi:unnamed protein product [Rhodiola kirilowii]
MKRKKAKAAKRAAAAPRTEKDEATKPPKKPSSAEKVRVLRAAGSGENLPIIKEVLEIADVLTGSGSMVNQTAKWLRWFLNLEMYYVFDVFFFQRQLELVYLIIYDILFGPDINCEMPLAQKEKSLYGDAENFLVGWKKSLQTALARVLVRKKVKSIDQLLALYQIKDIPKPRYVRVNTLKLDVESALHELSKQNEVQKDDLVPDLLILPPGSDLHDHPLVENGSLVLQGKASSMVAVALAPNPRWTVLDACAAPGNKTVHLAALMGGHGKIIACELNVERAKRLENTVRLSGANNIEIFQGDFLSLDPSDPHYRKVNAILLDPSCSGSGTASDRLDHLLPSFAEGNNGSSFADIERLNKLSAYQKKALSHALSFPEVGRVVYSTCSINQKENEDVVASVLPFAASHGFQLETALPRWPRRGLPVFEGSEHLVRTDPVEDKEGFFIALFVRKPPTTHFSEKSNNWPPTKKLKRSHSQTYGASTTKLSKMLLQFRR